MTLVEAVQLMTPIAAYLGAKHGHRANIRKLRELVDDAVKLHQHVCRRLDREARAITGEWPVVAPDRND